MSGSPESVLELARERFWAAERRIAFFDFDGVLSDIVDDTEAAIPRENVLGNLERLLATGTRVFILSSRPVSFLLTHFHVDTDPRISGLGLIGSKGLASYEDGQHRIAPGAERWSELVERAVDQASQMVEQAGLSQVDVEAKGLSLSLHYRMDPGAKEQVESIGQALVEEYGFDLEPGRNVVELEPDLSISKGTAIAERLPSHDWAMFAGDDVGDIPGFEAMRDHRDEAADTFCIGVASDEAPEKLAEAVDTLVDGPAGLERFLESLLEPPQGSA